MYLKQFSGLIHKHIAKKSRITMILVLSTLLMAACQKTVYMMPSPAAISTGDLDPFTDTPEEERNSNIMVGYVTNRIPFGSKDARFYTREFDQDLRMGNATVRIGDGEKSWDEILEMSRDGVRKEQVILSMDHVEEHSVLEAEDSVDALPDDVAEMMDNLNRYIEKSPLKDITVYVHGANNNFYRTAAQAAQYRHFTGRQAVVVLYSWPSAENIVRYGTDVRNIHKTVPAFVRFIQLLSKHSVARKIHILAYSAGSTLTTEGLAVLARDTSNPDRQAYRDSLRLGSVYYAAPDADFDEWVGQYRSYKDIVDRVTVTINQNDSVLGIAQTEHRANIDRDFDDDTESGTTKSRLGRPDLDDISRSDLDWLVEQTATSNLDVIDIDPSAIPGIGSGDHDFWYKSPWEVRMHC